MKFEGTLGNVSPKECLWYMEEILQSQEGEDDETGQRRVQMRKQRLFTQHIPCRMFPAFSFAL
ncbi:MAG: hypothetical protein QW595_02815 [Candidatus Bathyarchaeia archaeon]